MKYIDLTQGKRALVDDADYDRLNQWSWYAVKIDLTYYAARKAGPVGNKTVQYMHRVVMPLADDEQADHIDHDGLNNQRSNLRPASHAQNGRNRRLCVHSTSGYIGVSWYPREQKYRAKIQAGPKKVFLGYFDDPVEAAIIRDRAAIELHGEFANLNFPDLFAVFTFPQLLVAA